MPGAKSGGKQGQASESSPSGVTQDTHSSSRNKLWWHIGNVDHRRSLKTQGPWFSLGLVTWAPSAWHMPKFPTSRRTAGTQQKPQCISSLGTETHSSPGRMGTLSKSEFPGASPAKGISKDNSLRPTVLRFLHCF